MLAHSRNRAHRASRVQVGLVTAPKPATSQYKPLKTAPLIPNKVDYFQYARILNPLIKSFHNDDALENLIYMDPDVEHKAVENYLLLAKGEDGCDQGLSCPGWKDEDPMPTNGAEVRAREYRRSAFQHRVNARHMEDRIEERGTKVTKTQIATESALWQSWIAWLDHYKKMLAEAEKATLITPSEFKELQRADLELQAFRDKYRSITGLKPKMQWPQTPPNESNNIFGIPWNGLIAVAGVFGVGYIISGLNKGK